MLGSVIRDVLWPVACDLEVQELINGLSYLSRFVCFRFSSFFVGRERSGEDPPLTLMSCKPVKNYVT